MRIGAPLVALAFLLAPATGHACLASGPDGFSTGLVWDSKPSELPQGAFVVRIEAPEPIRDTWAFTAKVTEGLEGMVGRRYRFIPMNLNSCVGYGAMAGYAVVSPDKGSITMDGETYAVLNLVDYEPSVLNEVMRVVIGGSQWRYPCEPSEKQVVVP